MDPGLEQPRLSRLLAVLGDPALVVDTHAERVLAANAEQERLVDQAHDNGGRRAAVTARSHAVLLAHLGEVLLDSLEPARTLENAVRAVVPALADVCMIDVLEDDERVRAVVGHIDRARGVVIERDERRRRPGSARRPPTGPLERVLRTGQGELVPLADLVSAGALVPALGPGLARRDALVVPLRAQAGVTGALALQRLPPRPGFGPRDLALGEALGERLGMAVGNALAHQRVQERAAAQAELLAETLHDLKNPLAAILLRSELLRARARGSDGAGSDEVAGGLSRIEAAVRHLIRHVNELVDVGELRATGRLGLVRRSTDLVRLAREVVDDHQYLSRFHALRLATAERSLVGTWDGFRLERVLANLLSNAVKYSPGGGEIVVEVARRPGWAVLAVRDGGVGVPRAEIRRVFERYRRGSNVAGAIRGTGLGLVGARAIVEQHGGTISLASQEGRGTTVTVCLPIAADRPATD